jgi:acyl carrier protein
MKSFENSAENGSDRVMDQVIGVLHQTLQLGDRSKSFTQSTCLLGDIPELDSMAVLAILTALEEQFGIQVDDDDVSAESFETVGSLVALVREKTG